MLRTSARQTPPNLYLSLTHVPLLTYLDRLICMDYLDTIIQGDCEDQLAILPDRSVDLIFTSPPYANQRRTSSFDVGADQYVEWFMPKAGEFQRVLKPSGTFILNIKEGVVAGERHTYVI